MGLFKKKTEAEQARDKQWKLDRSLLDACKIMDLEKMRTAIASGANPNSDGWMSTSYTNFSPLRHMTALGVCLFYRFKKGAQFLLDECGADINYVSSVQRTALHTMADAGDGDGVKFLLDKCADTNIQDKNFNTAAMLAEAKGHLGIAQYIRSHGQKVQSADEVTGWVLLTPDTMAMSEDLDEKGFQRMTEIFNFKARMRHVIVSNDRGEVIEMSESFDKIKIYPVTLSTPVAEAEKIFKKLGGALPKIG